MRIALEPYMTRLACINAAARDIDRMSELMERQERECSDRESFSRWDEAFHLSIAEATRNPLLISLYRQINEVRAHQQWMAMKDKVLTPERIADYNRDHAALFEAIRVARCRQRRRHDHQPSALRAPAIGWRRDGLNGLAGLDFQAHLNQFQTNRSKLI